MTALKSHPHLLLSQHIEHIKSALGVIRDWHTPELLTPEITALAEKLAAFHDLGKGGAAFQEYIVAPEAYHGESLDKSHTPLSVLLTLLIARLEHWDALETLMLTAAIYGHHGRLPTFPSFKISELAEDEANSIDSFFSGSTAKALKKQLATLDLEALETESHTGVARVLLSEKSIREGRRHIEDELLPTFLQIAYPKAKMEFRLRTQLLYSMLLEADKAFLAMPNPETYLKVERPKWQAAWVEKRVANAPATSMNSLRTEARHEVLNQIRDRGADRLFSLTAPTGVGKTLLAASWALSTRETEAAETGFLRKVIVVLPFLSIIDQTAKEYGKLLALGAQTTNGSWLLTSHSLSERHYAHNMEEKTEHFFVDTWRSELIITTYDQFLFALLDPTAKRQMRFHSLCDALIIMDEVQSLPCVLWQLLNQVFQGLAVYGNSKLLLMSATLPSFVAATTPLLPNYRDYFARLNRYRLTFRLHQQLSLDDFCTELAALLDDWLENRRRVLITLNTRAGAQTLFKFMKKELTGHQNAAPCYLLSADVTPRDRLDRIEAIKGNQPCIVISTQCIEAGVDLDMNLVIRDFAPWDSLVQVAGRCNREGLSVEPQPVEIVDLVNRQGRKFSSMVYDQVHLSETRRLLEPYDQLDESEVLAVSDRYFAVLSAKKDTGADHLNRFLSWKPDAPIRNLLRDEDREQYSFIVADQDAELLDDLAKVVAVKDRWERREAWRSISGRIARVTVSVYSNRRFEPAELGRQWHELWILEPRCYDAESGLILPDTSDGDEGYCML